MNNEWDKGRFPVRKEADFYKVFYYEKTVKLPKKGKQMNSNLCAPGDRNKKWETIDWEESRYYVRKLQNRIVKAQQKNQKGKVKALQRLLTTSFYTKALAVRQVTQNKGKKTPGIDGELWKTTERRYTAIKQLKRNGYQPQPLRRIHIPKKNGKKRPLSIPTMKDRAMQTVYKMALEPIAETEADKNSYGFRQERCPQDALEQCFNVLAPKRSAEWILEGDIKGCFDNISHSFILEKIPIDKKVLKKWLKCGYIETKQLFPTEYGAPQGSPISPVICNMVLDGMERMLKTRFQRYTEKGTRRTPKVNMVRFADDFIVTGETKELLERKVLPLIKEFMEERGLELSEEKTVITNIREGVDFLGYNIRKYQDKLLIKPSRQNKKVMLEKVREKVKRNPSIKQEDLIRIINPIITGWVNYQKHNVSGETFQQVDNQIFHTIWKWCRRRHPKKGGEWIRKKYYQSINGNNWTFAAETGNIMSNGERYYLKLVEASNTDIIRYTKIQSNRNPFADEDREYFKNRESEKMRHSIKGREILKRMFYRQKGNCPLCGEKITIKTGYRISENQTNHKKWMIHRNCNQLEADMTEYAVPVL